MRRGLRTAQFYQKQGGIRKSQPRGYEEYIQVSKGTTVSVCKDDGQKNWQAHKTKKDIEALIVSRDSGATVARYDEWLILTRQ